ncbi:MAG: carboxypeptidase-like regulatory domain-containing protein [Bacteroidetes bacterium]|nr:carboxypeptidase-like regulatory domain-containing protein [Bacteroidota bacterium]
MKNLLLVVIGLLGLTGQSAYAQTGTLKGSLYKEIMGIREPLPMAKVRELEEGNFRLADDQGRFEMTLKEGTHHLIISFVGLVTDTIEVSVIAGQVNTMDIRMAERGDLAEVVVVVNGKTDGGTEVSAIQDVKEDDKVTNVQTATMMEQKGSGDVGDATKKMTGLSMVGSVLYVRGLGDRYNVAYMNNLPLPSPDPDFRVIPLSIFPTDIVSSVQVSKVMSPELYGDFSGGAFNITTRSFYDEPTLKVSVGGGLNTQTTFKDFMTYNGGKMDYFGFDDGSRNIPQFVTDNSSQAAYKEINDIYPSSLYTSVEGKTTGFHDNFGTFMKKAIPNTNFTITGGTFIPMAKSEDKSKGFGFLTLLSHENAYNYSYGDIQNINAQSESRLNYHVEKYNYTTSTTGLLNLYLRFSPDHNISINSLYVNTSDDETRESWGTHYDYARSIYSRRLTYEQNYVWVNQLIGTHKFMAHPEDKNFSRFTFDWRGSYSLTGSKEPDRRQFVAFYDEEDKEDTEHYTFMYIDRNENHIFYSQLNEREIAAKVNGEFVLVYDEVKDSVRGGIKVQDIISVRAGVDYKSKYREFDYKQYNYVLNTLAANTINNVDIYQIDSYLNSEVHDNGEFYISEVSNFGSSYIAELNVMSAYADVKFRLNKWEIIPGARFENGYQMVLNRDQTAPSEIDKTILIGGVLLPSLITKYTISEKDIVRFVATKTITRPKFNEVAPFQYTLFFAGAKAVGNSELTNSTNYNLDVRYEHYPKPGEMITVGGFYKYIDRPIEQTQQATASGQLLSYANANSATIAGVEIEYVRSLAFLVNESKRDSSYLKNFGIGFNASYMYTQVSIDTTDPGNINTNATRQLEGASPYLVNFDLRYEKAFAVTDSTDRKLMLALAYNVFGPRLYAVGSNGIGDQFAMPVNTLNFVAKIDFANRVTVGIKARNILNPTIQIVQEDKVDAGEWLNVSSYKRGIDFSFSIGYSF